MTPLISFLMSYRGRYATDASLIKLFESIKQHYPKKTIEILVRVDADDLHGKEKIKAIRDTYTDYDIKIFSHNRWEGRWSINYDYEFLFTRINPRIKFLGFITDDILFTRNILDNLNSDKLLIGDFKSDNIKEKFDLIEDYKSNTWLTPDYICAYPIISTKLIEFIGNFGWQINIDSTFALINVMMAKDYNIIISKHIPEFISRENIDRTEQYGYHLQKEWEMNDETIASDPYFWQLMHSTTKNIYLNLKYEK